jgi:hypothetical protein
MEEFKETFDAQLAPSGGDHVTSDPAISLVDGGVIRVDGEMHGARNGTTAALIDTLMSNKNLVSGKELVISPFKFFCPFFSLTVRLNFLTLCLNPATTEKEEGEERVRERERREKGGRTAVARQQGSSLRRP